MHRAWFKRHGGALLLWGFVGLTLLAVVLLALAIGNRRAHDEATTDAPDAARVLDVRVQVVAASDREDRIALTGRLEPWRDVTVSTEKPGRIVALPVERGQGVGRGDLLFRQDDRIWRAAQHQAELERDEARRVWARWEPLRESGGVSAQDFDTIQHRLAMAEHAVKQAAIHVSQCEVVSPVDGVVEDVFTEVGEYPPEGAAMVRVLEVARMKLVLDVPESAVQGITIRQKVPFTVSSAPGGVHTAEVAFVSSAADPNGAVFRTELTVDNGAGSLRAGMLASVDLVIGKRREAIAAPLDAVVPDRGDYVVFVVVDGHAVRRLVHLDAIRGHDAILADGLNPGERLVIEGQRRLVDGQPVRVVE